MKNKNLPLFEAALILLGETIVSLIVCGVYLILDKFSYKVITGAALGSVVTVANFLVLAITTGRAFDRAVEARGTREMTEEEADAFALEQQKEINNAVKLSFIIRNIVMLATLVVAFILDVFSVIATLVPLLMLKPIIIIETLIRQKLGKDKS
jgi:hypothetical protein